jgi:hypothetical protein
VSAYYFSYFDRNPYYNVSSQSNLPSSLVLDENHSRIDTTGLTATADLDGFVLRGEYLVSHNRIFPAFTGNNLLQVKTDETVYVLGVDFPTVYNISGGVQWSDSHLNDGPTGLLRPADQTYLSARLQWTFHQTQSLDLLYIYEPADAGERIQLEYLLPMTQKVELHMGADVLDGPGDSEFGRIRRGSRAYITLKSFFRG